MTYGTIHTGIGVLIETTQELKCQACRGLAKPAFKVNRPELGLDGVIFCSRCNELLGAPCICDNCKKPIKGQYVSAGGKRFHAECDPSGPPKKYDGGEFVVHTCEECKKPILTAGHVEVGWRARGKTWHIGCFSCSKCKSKIDPDTAKDVAIDQGLPLCDSCNKARADKCRTCGQPIVGKCVATPDGNNFHPEHFLCTGGCNKPITGGFAMRDGKPLCATCVMLQKK